MEKNYNYSIKTYIVALHPYDPLRTFEDKDGKVKSDTSKDSSIIKEFVNIINKQRLNELEKRKAIDYINIGINKLPDCTYEIRSNLKYYKFNKQIEKTIIEAHNSNELKHLKFVSLFETYFKQTDEEFLARNPFPQNYKTYDNTHWDKNTTIDYVNKLFNKNPELKSKISQ